MAPLSDIGKGTLEDNGALCRYLEWDSNFFGFRIARVEKERISSEEMLEIMSWCRQHSIDCLYFLADSSDADSIRLAEDYRFNLVDLRVTLDRKIMRVLPDENPRSDIIIRTVLPGDLPALRHIAGTSIRDTRFYYDSNFPRHLCVALYETWIEISFNGFADTILVAEVEKELAGFITCKLDFPSHGNMGLVGVALSWQGRGVGAALINGVLNWFASRRVDRVTVVTQGRNIPAMRLYQRCGFITCSTQLWYHRWFSVKK